MLEFTFPEKHMSQRRKLERKQDMEGDSVMPLSFATDGLSVLERSCNPLRMLMVLGRQAFPTENLAAFVTLRKAPRV